MCLVAQRHNPEYAVEGHRHFDSNLVVEGLERFRGRRVPEVLMYDAPRQQDAIADIKFFEYGDGSGLLSGPPPAEDHVREREERQDRIVRCTEKEVAIAEVRHNMKVDV
eukprot:CAMPEP_0206521198 /NCGR_PEP_ID=MMETSP0324_2-20121206/66192_1 /ASSEMBLY_ACC=CAM_ASM_000836 /TAXON_ID=2866 /ORGANISM="Crypthecodinium cohnii, Strain Seligo" /LENGTH=108 /DNA_ID=CAMNT_0054015021 /DNA_START=88 /DNA_END=414 /DNA_ORIENTATION=-